MRTDASTVLILVSQMICQAEAKEHFGLIPFPTTTEKLSIP